MKAVGRRFPLRMNPRSLRFQLLARSLLILAGLLILIGSLQYIFMKDFLYRNEAETIGVNAMGPLRGIVSDRPRGPVFLPDNLSIAFIAEDGTRTDLSGASGGAVSPELSTAELERLADVRRGRDEKGRYAVVRDSEGVEQLVVLRSDGGPAGRGYIQIGTPTAPLKAVALQQLLIFAALSILALAGGLALYVPVLRRTLRPLQQMVETVERTDAGNLDERFPTRQGQEEVDRLAESFNGMLGRLAASFEAERESKDRMRRFIADASHELRTPLTSIHGFLEVLLRGAAEKREQLYSALNSMLGESVRIKKLVEDLLLLAKLDSAPRLELRRTRLDGLIDEMEPHLRMLAGRRALTFVASSDLVASVDADQIKQVMLNLFQNAVQHTDPDRGSIEVALRADGRDALLSVADNGPGIPEPHLAKLFDRFYRVDTSRTRKLGGAGLGLSISQSIAEAHGGRIEVASELGRGSAFALRLPLAPPELEP
ncbi:sensor histidine kinase [Paenibacillus antri]|nr:HAMP domain-containing sensor histidine kinase [Paenibacillus antri]